jgi:N-acetylneuraminic acid mutarotase
MKRALLEVFFLFLAVNFSMAADEFQPMPAPLSNNAVAGIKVSGQYILYSFMGLGPAKTWNSVTAAAYALNLRYNKWTVIKPVPGSGRLGAVAAGVKEQVFVIGGFVPDSSGRQTIVSDVSIYEPIALRWYRGADLPSAVRDAVAGVYRDRYVYVIGGFGKSGPTNQVQVYDAEADRWTQAPPLPGVSVFGHAGGIVNDSIIYVDGASKNPGREGPNYVAWDECWMGKIDHKHPEKIQWSKLPPHPGAARYRIASGSSDRDQKIYFAGGSDKVYDYNGIGLDGKAAEPSSVVFDYNFKNNAWEMLQENTQNPTMDHRELAVTGESLILAGGMGKDQQVMANVVVLPKGK